MHINEALRCYLALLLCSTSVVLKAKDKVHWAVLDLPPYEYATGPEKGRGPVDELRKLLVNELTDFEHLGPTLVNQARLKKLFLKDDICHTAMFRTPETERNNYLSIPMAYANSHVLLLTKEVYIQMGEPKEVSLTELLKDTSLRMGVISRTLGKELDRIIKDTPNQSNIIYRKSLYTNQGLIKMLHRKRIDYFVDYPEQAMHWNVGNPKELLAAVPIKEVKMRYVAGRVTCSKTEVGRRVINSVNQILLREREKPEYVDKFVFDWLSHDMKAQYLEHYLKEMPKALWTNANKISTSSGD